LNTLNGLNALNGLNDPERLNIEHSVQSVERSTIYETDRAAAVRLPGLNAGLTCGPVLAKLFI